MSSAFDKADKNRQHTSPVHVAPVPCQPAWTLCACELISRITSQPDHAFDLIFDPAWCRDGVVDRGEFEAFRAALPVSASTYTMASSDHAAGSCVCVARVHAHVPEHVCTLRAMFDRHFPPHASLHVPC